MPDSTPSTWPRIAEPVQGSVVTKYVIQSTGTSVVIAVTRSACAEVGEPPGGELHMALGALAVEPVEVETGELAVPLVGGMGKLAGYRMEFPIHFYELCRQ